MEQMITDSWLNWAISYTDGEELYVKYCSDITLKIDLSSLSWLTLICLNIAFWMNS